LSEELALYKVVPVPRHEKTLLSLPAFKAFLALIALLAAGVPITMVRLRRRSA
jgi:hypothetical protein